MIHTFGRYLRQARVAAGLSLRDLAERLGISYVYLSEIERDKKAPLSESYFASIVRCLPTIQLSDLRAYASKPVSIPTHGASGLARQAIEALAEQAMHRPLDDDFGKEFMELIEKYRKGKLRSPTDKVEGV